MNATEEDTANTVIWHDVECGSYAEDLPLWERLADTAPPLSGAADVLDLGAGTGRVATHLARRGHRVWALDHDEVLVDVLRARAEAEEAGVTGAVADARNFSLPNRFGLICAPMQLAHLFTGDERSSMLASVASHLEPGGIAAFALMAAMPEPWRAGRDGDAPAPDVGERDAWVFSSLPVAVEADPGVGIVVHRLRQTVSPEGALSEEEHVFRLAELSAGRLEQEAAAAGLRPRERHEVAETDDFVGSTVVVVEAPE